MKWIGISGSWRATSAEVEKDVRDAVRNIMMHGNGIVSGGALNVDYFATDEALMLNPDASRIKIFLPVTLERYVAHYRKRAEEGVITSVQAETLIAQLARLQSANPAALIENKMNTECNPTTYYERNTEVVNASDELLAFIVNESAGTKDTIDKMRIKGKPVTVKSYKIA
jgi:hypothetical protein